MSQADSGLSAPSDPPRDPLDPSTVTSQPQPTSAQSRTSTLLLNVLIAPASWLWSSFSPCRPGYCGLNWPGCRATFASAQPHAVVGYLNIAPVARFDEGPKDWYKVEGDQSYLWFGWDKESDHRWFRFAAGEIDPRRLYRPTSEFISQAIDFPLVETSGGTIWQRMPSESPVVGCKIEKQLCVYPVAILGKVIVINDIVDKHPYMVVVNPFARPVVAFSIYDAPARRAPGHAGPHRLFSDGKPILFDRGTESLWIDDARWLDRDGRQAFQEATDAHRHSIAGQLGNVVEPKSREPAAGGCRSLPRDTQGISSAEKLEIPLGSPILGRRLPSSGAGPR